VAKQLNPRTRCKRVEWTRWAKPKQTRTTKTFNSEIPKRNKRKREEDQRKQRKVTSQSSETKTTVEVKNENLKAMNNIKCTAQSHNNNNIWHDLNKNEKKKKTLRNISFDIV
jgi:hypothetical protein